MKTAIITGASSGIGLACAHRFALGGWQLVLIARRNERLTEIGQEFKKKFNTTSFLLTGDVRNPQTASQLSDLLQNNNIIPDLLINNAGLARGLDPIQDGKWDDWDEMIDTNLKGLLRITKAALPLMVEARKGHIINIGSVAGKEAYAKGNVYCATKHAVDGLTKAMRYDHYTHGIRVTQIAPGAVETEFSNVRFHGDNERAAAVYKGFQPLTANDIADAVWYCANVPEHVSIHDLFIMPTVQAGASTIHRSE